MKRVVLHYDMDYFFAQILERDNKDLRGKPVVVGAMPDQRGIVTTCNYIARKYGIKSGMSSHQAYIRCPQAVFCKPNSKEISRVSKIVRNIAREYSDETEFVGTDEGYIELTHTRHLFHRGNIDEIAFEIKNRIFEETGLTCSVGVGYNKLSAKIGSNWNKPNGFKKWMDREKLLKAIRDKDADFLHGIGKNILKTLNNHGYFKIKDIQEAGLEKLTKIFGVYGEFLNRIAFGIDNRPVSGYYEEKGIGNDRTVPKNISGIHEIKKILVNVVQQACFRMKKNGYYCRTITVRLRYDIGFRYITRAMTVKEPLARPHEVLKIAEKILLEKVEDYNEIRLVGIRLSHLTKNGTKQLSFDDSLHKIKKLDKIDDLKYDLRKKYGYNIVTEGIESLKQDVSLNVNNNQLDEIRSIRTTPNIKSLYR